MSAEFGPYTPQVRAFLQRLEELTDEQWGAVVAVRPACKAAFGECDSAQLQSILRSKGRWEAADRAAGAAGKAALGRFSQLPVEDRFARAAPAAEASLALVGGSAVWTPWFRAMYAPFARVIELEDLPANDYPAVPDPPESLEERFVWRIQALTGQWEGVLEILSYSTRALGKDLADATFERAAEAAETAWRAGNTLKQFFENGGPYLNREVSVLLAKMAGSDQSWADGHRAARSSKNRLAEHAAFCAILALSGAEFLSDNDFSLLYLPFCAAVPFDSLF